MLGREGVLGRGKLCPAGWYGGKMAMCNARPEEMAQRHAGLALFQCAMAILRFNLSGDFGCSQLIT